MGSGIGYSCKCGYGVQYSSGYGMNDTYAIFASTLHTASYCEICGFVQPKIRDEDVEQVFNDSGYDKVFIDKNNHCQKCNGNLKILNSKKVNDELGIYFNSHTFRYNTEEVMVCTGCKELQEVPIYYEYFVDIDTKEVVRKNNVRDSECRKCKTKFIEIESKGEMCGTHWTRLSIIEFKMQNVIERVDQTFIKPVDRVALVKSLEVGEEMLKFKDPVLQSVRNEVREVLDIIDKEFVDAGIFKQPKDFAHIKFGNLENDKTRFIGIEGESEMYGLRTKIKCPKCGKFDMEEQEMLSWD